MEVAGKSLAPANVTARSSQQHLVNFNVPALHKSTILCAMQLSALSAVWTSRKQYLKTHNVTVTLDLCTVCH